MDFWAQHKEFILKVLAGVGVFLVALIARSITYGDDLEKAQSENSRLENQIRVMKIAPVTQIEALELDADRLQANAEQIAEQVGWNLEESIEQRLLERIMRYTRRYARADAETVRADAAAFRQALNEDLNGGFAQLRLAVRQELVEEASERNIKILEGIGYDNVTELESDELLQYLMQLELVARVVRYAIDAGVDSIEDVKITGRRRDEEIPGANPEFLVEYPVTIVFATGQEAFFKVLDRLEAPSEGPRPPLTALRLERLKRPADHIAVTLTLRATAANPKVKFEVE